MYMCSSQSSCGLVDMNGVSQEAEWGGLKPPGDTLAGTCEP